MTSLHIPGKDKSPVFLMDGTAFIYRSFYAQRHLRRSDGFPTNALALVTRLLLRIMREERPEYFLFVMDGRGKNFRHEIYADYKANREAMPEELARQLEPIKSMVAALGLPQETASGCEADDCIASLAARFSPERPVVIISGDKDLKQCLATNVFMWDPAGKDEKLLTITEFEAETGVPPSRWPDVQALIGDSVDNIPGVPGIGPKTAMQIFKTCPTLEAIRDHLERLPLKLQAKLQPHLDDMFRWRRLTTLKKDACPDLALADLKTDPIDRGACARLAGEYELVAIGREIGAVAALAPVSAEIPAAECDAPTFAAAPAYGDRALLPDCAGKDVAVIWADGPGQAPHVAVGAIAPGPQGGEFVWTGTQEALQSWLLDARNVVTDNLKEKMRLYPEWRKLVYRAGIDRFVDVGLAAYLLNPEDGDYSWPRVAARWRETLDASVQGPASFGLGVAHALLKNMAALKLEPLYRQIEMPLAPVLADMEALGFAISPPAFTSFLEDVSGQLNLLTAEIHEDTGATFNIRSSRQLAEVLFDKLGLASGRKTKTGQPSTSELALEKLAATEPVVEKILRFRKLDKILGTYLEPLPRLMDGANRIHTTFNQTATATGRISSSNPNLQNIPVRGAMGRRMRACFVPAPGHLLVAVDYSQIELRLLAHLSQDANLLAAFRQGEDIHARTAALILDIAPGQVSPDQRRMAKTINFGLLYGMGARKLAQELRIADREAAAFISRYFSRLSGLKAFYEQVLAGAKTNGFVTTMAGRRRWLPGITSANGQIAAQAERQAVNAVTQGSAADIIKLAMLAVAHDAHLRQGGARLVLQVHDELLLEAPAEFAQEACARVVDIMQGVRPGGTVLSVPLTAEGGTGVNWAQAH